MWSFKKIFLVTLATVGGGALAVVTGGAAAPFVGGLVGGAMGLSGAAATSAGLAAIGGGAVAAGGAGMAGGAALVTTEVGVVGAAGSAVATGALSADPKDLEKLQTIAAELRDEIRRLKAALNDTTIKTAEARELMKRELDLKEERLKRIEATIFA